MIGRAARGELELPALGVLAALAVTVTACGGGDPVGALVTKKPVADSAGTLSLPPVSEPIAFVGDRTYFAGQGDPPAPYIYLTLPGSTITALTSGSMPAWSPDGRKLAFVRPLGEVGHPGGIYVAVLGDEASPATWLVEGNNPSWSPDGTRIVFDRVGDISVIDADGTHLATLLSYEVVRGLSAYGSAGFGDPAWSPDGEQIVFTRYGDFSTDLDLGADQLYVMSFDGSNVRPFIAESGCNHSGATWSPDGSQVAFMSCRGISVAAADGSAERSLTEGRDPAWSPDGRLLAFADEHSWRVIDAEGGAPELLIPNGAPTGSGFGPLTWRASP